MQASSLYFPCSSPLTSTKTLSNTLPSLFPTTKHHHYQKSIFIKATNSDIPQVDYTSMTSSVFPAEACETLGGVACEVDMFPETKPKTQPDPNTKVPSQTVDREYLEYNSPKTVFIAEACDDLGGEFCEPNYQTGLD